jgi:hypothetical protein
MPYFDDNHLCKGNSIFISTQYLLVNQYLFPPGNLHITSLQWRTFYEILGGGGLVPKSRKILNFGSRKWHLQHSENTFCKKLGFQNTDLMVGIQL